MGRKRENLLPKLFLTYDHSYPMKTCQDLSLKHRVGLFGCLWMVSGMLGPGAGGPRARELPLPALPWGALPARPCGRSSGPFIVLPMDTSMRIHPNVPQTGADKQLRLPQKIVLFEAEINKLSPAFEQTHRANPSQPTLWEMHKCFVVFTITDINYIMLKKKWEREKQ